MGALVFAVMLLAVTAREGSEASSGPIVGVDALSDLSNTASTIGAVDACRTTTTGATFDVDIVIQSVDGLSGIEANLLYDGTILQVIAADYDFFLSLGGNGIIDLGDTVPDADGDFSIGAVTFPLSAIAGSGVVVRVTLEAVGSGVSALDLAGVKLSDALAAPIQPADSTGVYLGPVNDASVAVDAECGDADGDGYQDSVEGTIGTDPMQNCGNYDLSHPNPNADTKPSLHWPSDFNMATGALDSYNKINVLDVSSFLAPVRYLGTDVGTNPGDGRWDLVPGPGVFSTDINVHDLTTLIAGTTGNPPMFGGARALGGPACTP